MNNISSPPNKLVTPEDWNNIWTDNFAHYQNDTRHAYYIDAVRRRNERKVLEIAAGSFRDVAQLSQVGVECYGIDFSTQAVSLAQQYYPQLASRFAAMDAFNLDFADSDFDLTYHNGFWVCFDDAAIHKLVEEQARVTRRRLIATVHNAHNKAFKAYFDSKTDTDPLFSIRFFESDEIAALMRHVCKKVTVIPVGKGKKRYEDWLIRQGLGHPAILNSCFALSGQRLRHSSERLLCIGEL